MSIVITLVAEENGRLTEIAEVKGKALKTANLIVKKIDPNSNTRKSFEEHSYYFNVQVQDRTVYLCATPSSGKQRICWAFLESIRKEYEDRGYGDREDLTRFEDFIEEQMDLYSNHPDQVDKVKNVQQKVDDVKEIALSNIDRLLERGEKIENLEERTADLESQGKQFNTVAKKQKWMEWRRNIFWTIVLIVCCFILLAVIVAIIAYFASQA